MGFDISQLDDCELLRLAREWQARLGVISCVFLQRKLRINYSKAMELVSKLKFNESSDNKIIVK